MNRDNLLFALMGILIGFVAAYPVFEVMSGRQAPLRTVASQGPAGELAAPGSGAAPSGGPPMEAVQRLRERVEQNPDDADALLELAQLNLQINDLIRARGLFERYVQLRPGDDRGLLVLGNLYFDTKEYSRAREVYETFLERRPDDPDVLTDLGVSYRNLGQPQKALGLFQRAGELKPEHWVALYNEVIVLGFDLKDYPAADRSLSRLRSLQPDNPDIARLAEELARQRGNA